MKRVEELTQKRLDGQLTTAEMVELDRLLERDPAARAEYRALLQVEVALRNLDEKFDVADAVMAQIKAAPHAAPELPVRRSKVVLETWFDRWFLKAGVPLAAAAGLAIAFLLFHQTRFPAQPATASQSGQRPVVQGARIVRHGVPLAPAAPAQTSLLPQDELLALAGTVSRLTYDDRTEVLLSEGTRVVYQPDVAKLPPGSKCLELLSGRLEAQVPKQPGGAPFILKTANAQATVRGTKFALIQSARQTRLEVSEGRVDFRRSRDGATVSVGQGCFAVSSEKGKLVSRPQRVAEGLLAYYTFEEGDGSLVRDRSGRGAPLDMAIAGKGAQAKWSDRGLSFAPAGYLLSTAPATQLNEAIRKSGALTLEVWIEPADATQSGPARLLTLSESSTKLNVMLAQGPDETRQDAYVSSLRTSKDGAGDQLRTPSRLAATKLTHLVFTREAKGPATLYLDGKRVAGESQPGSLANWHGEFRLALGGAPGTDRFWKGAFRLAAIYSRALSSKEVARNHQSGADQSQPLPTQP